MTKKARLIAFYLPQFHPVPENDEWWGKGFTEWTNVTKAKPLFKGHFQPHLPADLGFYDLRVPETREAQADLAREYGIEGFCYWHYWFGNGRRILERPFNEVLKSGKPDFPFCLGWANQTWSGIWHGAPNRVLIEQTYPGPSDYEKHFYTLLEAFHDSRYMTVHGKVIFLLYAPASLPNAMAFTEQWRELAVKEGLKGIHFIGHNIESQPHKYGCDAFVANAPFVFTPAPFLERLHSLVRRLKGKRLPTIRSYAAFVRYINNLTLAKGEYPLIVPNWDNTPRSNKNGFVLQGSTPELFRSHVLGAMKKIDHVEDYEDRILFIKAWNEWAEGNYLEPDRQYGHAYLQVIKEILSHG